MSSVGVMRRGAFAGGTEEGSALALAEAGADMGGEEGLEAALPGGVVHASESSTSMGSASSACAGRCTGDGIASPSSPSANRTTVQ